MTRLPCPSSLFGLVLVASLFSGPQSASEDYPKVCDPDNPSKCSQYVETGSQVPFTGQLMTTELAMALGMKATYADERLALELKFQKKMLSIDLELEKHLRKNDQEAAKAQIDFCVENLEKMQRPWYEHPLFISGITATVVILVMYGSVEALKSMK